jgi:hypothetical protein
MQFYKKKHSWSEQRDTTSLHFTVHIVKQTVTENSEHDSECTYLNMYSTVTPQIMSAIISNTVLQSRKPNYRVDNQSSIPAQAEFCPFAKWFILALQQQILFYRN